MTRVTKIWVARLNISQRTAEKIIQEHGITPDEVRQAVVCVEGLGFARHYHEERGWRVIIKIWIRWRPVVVVLYEDEDPMGDVWNLGSAYFANGG